MASVAAPDPPCAAASLQCDLARQQQVMLSRPQKRRRRLQREAVRKAQVSSAGVLNALGLPSRPLSYDPEPRACVTSVDMKLLSLEYKLDLILSMMSRSAELPASRQIGGGLADDGDKGSVSRTSCLDPSAPVFRPASNAADHVGQAVDLVQASGVWEPLPFLSQRDGISLRAASRYHAHFAGVVPRVPTVISAQVQEHCKKDERAQMPKQPLHASVSSLDSASHSGSASQKSLGSSSQSLRYPVRVEVPRDIAVAADDIWDHFSQFGQVDDLEYLDDDANATAEVFRIFFSDSSNRVQAMKRSQQRVKRSHDGRLVPVKVYVKFTDNTAEEERKRK